jgi:small subunit ribosomal protein S1
MYLADAPINRFRKYMTHKDSNENSEDQQWQIIEEHYKNGKPLAVRVIEATKNRIIVEYENITGVVERPHYSFALTSLGEHPISSREDVQEHLQRHMEQMKGKMILLKVLEVDRERKRLLFSQQLYTEQERQAMRSRQEQLLQEVQPGDIRKGIVISLARLSVSVDAEGVEGWIPRHYLSLQNHRIDPDEVVQLGREIEVMVVDKDTRKARLSLVHAQQRDTVIQTMKRGQILTARICCLLNEGAYVDLEGPIGLIPANQIVHSYVTHPADVFHKGQEVVVKLEDIDDNKKVILSLIEAK